MEEYHKIQTVFKRDMEKNPKLVIDGDWTMPEFEYLAENQWEWTEKIDGTNIRIGWDGKDTEKDILGRSEKSDIPKHLMEALGNICPKEALTNVFGTEPNATLYGEGYGPKIQKGGGNYRDDAGFILFDVKIDNWWLRRSDVNDIAQRLGIDFVPVVGQGTLLEAIAKIKAGVKSTFGDFLSEGYVLRPMVELSDRSGKRIITKLKHRDFGITG
jgi:hypothetical protein